MAKMISFGGLSKEEEVDLIRMNGEVHRNIKATMWGNTIHLKDTLLFIEEGDTIQRVLPNGMQEKYTIINVVYNQSYKSAPASYRLEVEKQTKLQKPAVESIVFNSSGHNTRININSTDNSTNVVAESITENNVFQKLREAIEQQVTSEEKEVILSSVDQLEQTKGTSKYVSAYQSFIQTAKDWMTIIGPFIPMLTPGLQG
jgi:hypothetical protein